MFEIENAKLVSMFHHHIGNKHLESGANSLRLNDSAVDIANMETHHHLVSYFLSSFEDYQSYYFSQGEGPNQNVVYTEAQKVFESPETLKESSQVIARILFESIDSANIPSGGLSVVYFSGCALNSNNYDAIGLFKSDEKSTYVNFENESPVKANYGLGFDVNKLKKGCLIFNTRADQGYKILLVDGGLKLNKKIANYWKKDFLNLKAAGDDYQNTNEVLTIAQKYVTREIPDYFFESKADKVELLDRSVNYFKDNETFNKEDFAKEVFQDEGVIESFNQFDNTYREENDINHRDNFDISEKAVKKQARFFKRVLKLDKNFHIYIHGDRKQIQQGVESDGRKFYKVYFDKES